MRHRIPQVSDGRAVTLLGDAAHTMPPFLAQGTNQALLDTMVLRTALADGLPGALRCYENLRRRQVGAVSWLASRQVSQKDFLLRPAAIIPDRFTTWALTSFLGAVSHRSIAQMTTRRLAAGQRSHGPGLHQTQR